MRVIAGSARGRAIIAPKTSQTRPTSDLIRGVIFNLLSNELDSFGRVLDLYAGSGALGIEALSRGAEWVDFVDKAPLACRAITQNLERLGFASRAKVHCQPVARALAVLPGRYTIILLDPPYADPSLDGVLGQIERADLLEPGGLAVVEHARKRPVGEGLQLAVVKDRCHGDTCVSIFRRGDER